MKLRHGFKTESNVTSRELRRDLKLDLAAPVCPFELCKYLGVTFLKLSDFLEKHPEATTYLMGDQGRDEFFAMTLCGVSPKVIIYNDAQSPWRTAADIAHELAHLLLMHPSHRLSDATGRRHFDAELEAEANWLGPAILVSEEAALAVVSRGLRLSEAAREYGVSHELMQMRLNVTGASKRARRAA
jgi:hypothetical protein